MKNSRLSFVVGGLLLLLFMALLFCFQVRNTEVAVVTTFGRYSRDIADPGLYFRLPVPIQSVYRFDNRLQNFEIDPLTGQPCSGHRRGVGQALRVDRR